MADGVPIRVKIGLKYGPKGNREHDYPDWTTLPLAGVGTLAEREQAVAEHQLIKWCYDHSCGHDDEDAFSPRGVWWGMMVVTPQFANEAIARWPDRVFEMTEAQAADFHDNRHAVRQTDETFDEKALTGLKAMVELRQAAGEPISDALKARLRNALDPDHAEAGVKRNRKRRWAMRKADAKLNIVPRQ